MEKVSQAFTQSQPDTLKAAQKSDALKPGREDSFQRGLDWLARLIQQMENERTMSPTDQAKQGLKALHDLQQGLDNLNGSNEPARELLARLEKELKKPEPSPNPADFKELFEELQKLSAEASEHLAAKDEKLKVMNIDPARLPPAYRSRIEKYFQKLSER